MRHRVKTDSLSRFSSFRKATIRSMTISILLNEKIITTMAKAKMARREVDKIISLGKKNTLASKRRAFSLLCDHKLVKVLFDQIAPKFSKRTGGYTRIIPYRFRRGDNAELVVLELTELYKVKKLKEKPKKEVKQEKAPNAKVATPRKPADVETKVEKIEQALPTQEELVTKLEEEEQKKAEQEKSPLQKEERKQKKVQEPEVQQYEARDEEKIKKPDKKEPKKFLGGLKNFFKKKNRDSR